MHWRQNLRILCFGVFIANISFTFTIPFMPDLLKEIGVKDNLSLWTGVMIAASFLSSALMAPIWGALADRYGKRIMLARSGFGMVVTFCLMALCSNIWQLLFIRALNGMLSGFIPASTMLVVSNTPEEEMAYALGFLNTFTAVGGIMGPIVAGFLLQLAGIRTVIFIATGLLLMATLLSFFGTKEKIVPQKARTTIVEDLTIVLQNKFLRMYIFCLVMLQLGSHLITPTLPLRVAELTTVKPELITGIIFSITGVSLAIGSPLICRIKKLDYFFLLLLGLFLSGGVSVMMGLTSSLVLLGIERFLFGFTCSLVNVSGNVLVTHHSPEEMRGRVFGILNSFVALGMFAGPLIGGFIGEHFNYASAFQGSAFFFILAAVVALYCKRKASAVITHQ